jgi:WD40 repeat protein
MPQNFKYWLFISYSHQDKKWADWLFNSFEKYRIPKQIRGTETQFGKIPERIYPVFRDREESPASANLGKEITTALEQSQCLVVICSPNSAKSHWVNEEIMIFKRLGRSDRIFVLIVDGEPNVSVKSEDDPKECLPKALCFERSPDGILTDEQSEPLAADVRPQGDGKENAKLKLLAGILGLGFDALKRRELQRRHQWLIKVIVFVSVISSLLILLAVSAWVARNEAIKQRDIAREAQSLEEKQSRIATANLLALQSRAMLKDFPQRSLILAVESLNIHLRSKETPLPEAEQALQNALGNIQGYGLSGHKSWIETLAISPDSRWLITGSKYDTVRVWDLKNADPSVGSIVLNGHFVNRKSAIFSSDNRWLITGFNDDSVHLWKLKNEEWFKQSTVLEPHSFDTHTIALSHDGHLLATEHGDHEVRLWNLDNDDLPKVVSVLNKHKSEITAMTFSPDDEWLITGTAYSKVYLWNLKSLHSTKSPIVLNGHHNKISGIEVSSNGRWLITSSEGSIVETSLLWNLTNLEPSPKSIAVGGSNAICAFALNLNKHWLITRSNPSIGIFADRTVRLWDLSAPNKSLKPIVLSHSSKVMAAATSKDGRWFVTGTDDGNVYLWDLTIQDPAKTRLILQGHKYSVTSVRISPDNKWIATAGREQDVRLWHLNDADPSIRSLVLRGHEDWVNSIEISSDGKWLVTAGNDKTARLWDLNLTDPSDPTVLYRLVDEQVRALAINRDGQILTVLSSFDWNDGALQLLMSNFHTTSPRRFRLHGHKDHVGIVTFSSGHRWLITGSWDNTARLWDLAALDPSQRPIVLDAHHGAVNALAFSIDGQYVVTGSSDKTAILWNLSENNPSALPNSVFRGHKKSIVSVAISSDNHWLATGSSDNTAILWDLTAEEPNRKGIVLEGHEREVNELVFSPNSKWLITGSGDGTIRKWDLAVTDPSPQSIVLRGHENAILQLVVSPDSRWLVTTYFFENTPLLWDLTMSEQSITPTELRGHDSGVNAVRISPDSKRFISSSHNDIARLWSLSYKDPSTTSVLLRGDGQEGSVYHMAISPNGQWITTASHVFKTSTYNIRLWSIDLIALLDNARRRAGRNLNSEEWRQFFSGKVYQKTFENLPPGK